MGNNPQNGGTNNIVRMAQTRFLLLLTIIVLIYFLWMIKGFLMTLFLAGILAALTHPLYQWFYKKTGGKKKLSISLTTTTIVVLIVFPTLFVSGVFVDQTQQLINLGGPWWQDQVKRMEAFATNKENASMVSIVQQISEWVLARMEEITDAVGRFTLKAFGSVTTGIAAFLLNFFVFVFALAYFYGDGIGLVNKFQRAMSELTGSDKNVLERIYVVSRATIKGTVVIAIVQGILGGVAIYFAGVPAPVFWGGIIALLSLLPIIGPPFVWLPVALFLIFNDHTSSGIFLLLFGVIILSNVDNILRPILVGSDTGLPNLTVLVSTLGGISAVGAAGVIIGPVVAAVCISAINTLLEQIEKDIDEDIMMPNLPLAGPSDQESSRAASSGEARSRT